MRDEWNFCLRHLQFGIEQQRQRRKSIACSFFFFRFSRNTYIFEIVKHLLQYGERQIWSSGDVNGTAK